MARCYPWCLCNCTHLVWLWSMERGTIGQGWESSLWPHMGQVTGSGENTSPQLWHSWRVDTEGVMVLVGAGLGIGMGMRLGHKASNIPPVIAPKIASKMSMISSGPAPAQIRTHPKNRPKVVPPRRNPNAGRAGTWVGVGSWFHRKNSDDGRLVIPPSRPRSSFFRGLPSKAKTR